jgi:hypothetical protein
MATPEVPYQQLGWLGIACCVLVLLAIGLWLGVLATRWLRSYRASHSARDALRREDNGVLLLERAGYTIIGRQVRKTWPVAIDGQVSSITLRVDYLVERHNRLYVADAKSGNLAASLRHGPTRRQLLEYQLAYGADGALLVDTFGLRVLCVSFPSLPC